MGEREEQLRLTKHILEQWRNVLYNWIIWLDAEIDSSINGNRPNRLFDMVIQHVALIKPWFKGLSDALPKETSNVPITRVPSELDRHDLRWNQCISEKSLKQKA